MVHISLRYLAKNVQDRVVIVLLSIALAACGGGNASSSTSGPSNEIINGISVPPEPDLEVNVSTVAGVDTDGNGIRDDVDRQIATEFGNEPLVYAKATVFFKTEQAALLNPDPLVVEAHLASLSCIQDQVVLERLSNLTNVVVNTLARGKAYARAFAGVTLTERVCP